MLSENEINDMIIGMLFVKAALAILASVLFIYYKAYWDRAVKVMHPSMKNEKWRMARHVFILGIAAIGFAAGFSIEALSSPLGISANKARLASTIFEIVSLIAMLFGFYHLACEDVPHFQHTTEIEKAKKRAKKK